MVHPVALQDLVAFPLQSSTQADQTGSNNPRGMQYHDTVLVSDDTDAVVTLLILHGRRWKTRHGPAVRLNLTTHHQPD